VLDGIALSKGEQQQADEKFSGKAGSKPRVERNLFGDGDGDGDDDGDDDGNGDDDEG